MITNFLLFPCFSKALFAVVTGLITALAVQMWVGSASACAPLTVWPRTVSSGHSKHPLFVSSPIPEQT